MPFSPAGSSHPKRVQQLLRCPAALKLQLRLQWSMVILGFLGGGKVWRTRPRLFLGCCGMDEGWLPAEGSKGAQPRVASESDVQHQSPAATGLGWVRSGLGCTYPLSHSATPLESHERSIDTRNAPCEACTSMFSLTSARAHACSQ